jgi:hypothetical protein
MGRRHPVKRSDRDLLDSLVARLGGSGTLRAGSSIDGKLQVGDLTVDVALSVRRHVTSDEQADYLVAVRAGVESDPWRLGSGNCYQETSRRSVWGGRSRCRKALTHAIIFPSVPGRLPDHMTSPMAFRFCCHAHARQAEKTDSDVLGVVEVPRHWMREMLKLAERAARVELRRLSPDRTTIWSRQIVDVDVVQRVSLSAGEYEISTSKTVRWCLGESDGFNPRRGGVRLGPRDQDWHEDTSSRFRVGEQPGPCWMAVVRETS